MLQRLQSKRKLESSQEHSAAEPHVLPLKVYYGVFASLLVLTVITVLVSVIGLPPTASIVAAILVATVKASIVAAFFMHLIAEDKFYTVILLATVFFVCLFFVLTILDVESRGLFNQEETPQYFREYGPSLNPPGT